MVLAGKPLIAYSILQAKASRYINKLVVSTDDDEIAGVARDWGAEVPFIRPREYACDDSPDIQVFQHALLYLKEQEGYCPDVVVHLRPPGPVRDPRLVDKAIELLLMNPQADSIRSVGVAKQTPYKMWSLSKDGFLKPLLRLDDRPTECQSMPRQQLPIAYWQNGYVDVIRPRAILEGNSMCGSIVLPFIVEEELFELDYPEQIPEVEAALRSLETTGKTVSPIPTRLPV